MIRLDAGGLGRTLVGRWLDLDPVAGALIPTFAAAPSTLARALRHRCAVRHQAAADTLATADCSCGCGPGARQRLHQLLGLRRLAMPALAGPGRSPDMPAPPRACAPRWHLSGKDHQ